MDAVRAPVPCNRRPRRLHDFSAFSLDAVVLWQRGESVAAGAYVLASVVLSIAGLLAGLFVVRVLTS